MTLNLEFYNSGGSIAQFPLRKKDNHFSLVEDMVTAAKDSQRVFSDGLYPHARVVGEEGLEISKVLINNNEVVYHSAGSFFENGQLFADCFGYVRISLCVKKSDDVFWLETGLIHVLIHSGAMCENVKRMAAYVYDNYPLLLCNPNKGSEISNSQKKFSRGLEAKIEKCREIANLYEQNFGYFKTNYRFTSVQQEVIDDFEKMRQFTPRTVQYISQHPSLLHQTADKTGIKIGMKSYMPDKTLFQKTVFSADIYENQVIVSFIRYMIGSLTGMLSELSQWGTSLSDNQIVEGDYISSSEVIFSSTRDSVMAAESEVKNLLERFEVLMRQYYLVLPVSETVLAAPPKPSAVFLAIPQYNMIYSRIHEWFSLTDYDVRQESSLLSYILVSQLYEVYSFTRLINALKDSGYRLMRNYYYQYSYIGSSPQLLNTFEFEADGERITLYYQPVIQCNQEENGLDLYRNTSLSFNGEIEGYHYSPDFVIKFTRKNEVRYLICDAKFRNVEAIRRSIPEYAYKYDYSISTTKETAVVKGIVFFSGKELEKSEVINARDMEREPKHTGHTVMDIIPLTEKADIIQQRRVLSDLLNSIREVQ